MATASSVTLDSVTIATTGDSSRGVDATYLGVVTLSDCSITTSGAHCAALASDRGTGVIKATDCTGTTSGEGSPGIYCTGTFTVTGGDLSGQRLRSGGHRGAQFHHGRQREP